MVLIDDNGAPRSKKHFLFYNPPVINAELGLRRSVVTEVCNVAKKILPTGAQIIVFARSRLRVEILLTYLHDIAGQLKIPKSKIRGYRGGYLPRERREIERGLKNGQIQVVVSTNALELGIDIGQLDVAIRRGCFGPAKQPGQVIQAGIRPLRRRRRKADRARQIAALGDL